MFSLTNFAVGTRTLVASFVGDATSPATISGIFVLTVTAPPVVATANAVVVAYGLPIPALTGTLAGVLPADAANVAAVFATTAAQGSNVGTYPITVTLTGSAAGNHSVTSSPMPGSVAITPGITGTSLKVDKTTVYAGVPIHVTATVFAATGGTAGAPDGVVSVFNGSQQIGSNVALTNGVATLTATISTAGTQQLNAVYVPAVAPQNWSASTSNAIVVLITPAPDFLLSAPSAAQPVIPGQSVGYTISVSSNPGPFTSPITFAVSGLPAGATATFAPGLRWEFRSVGTAEWLRCKQWFLWSASRELHVDRHGHGDQCYSCDAGPHHNRHYEPAVDTGGTLNGFSLALLLPVFTLAASAVA